MRITLPIQYLGRLSYPPTIPSRLGSPAPHLIAGPLERRHLYLRDPLPRKSHDLSPSQQDLSLMLSRALECAMAAQADWIVSGDRHLLALKHHAGSAIISLAHFLAELEK